MLHLLLYGLLAVVIAVGLFLLAARFLPAGEQIAPPVRDEPPWAVPDTLTGADIDAVRLPVALRGYRFAETDLLLDRLAEELRARDAEIVRLRQGGGPRPSYPPRPAPMPDTYFAPSNESPSGEPVARPLSPPAGDDD
ncbi:MAG: DivIVA domain-containing protein [Actinobacteria bacterium]|nr:DivIVA domain-containing protein [Actinomycetota bacterium]